MSEFREQCRKQLNRALEEDDVAEKNYYIRQILQFCDIPDMPSGTAEQREVPKQ